jgi:arylsulfatase
MRLGLALVVVIAGFVSCGRGTVAPSAGRASVLLITVDTLRADHLGSYGLGVPASPEIDRLAAQGVLFERAIAGSSATAPSHAAILTSRFSREHSIGFRNGDTRLEGVPTLASLFRGAGYATAAFVSNVVPRRGRGFETGFDVFDDDAPAQEANRPVHERIAAQTTAAALAWLATPREQPFFLWVHYQDPHGPYAPPPVLRGRFHLPGRVERAPLPVLADDSGIGGYIDEIFYADVSIGQLIAAADHGAGARGAVVRLTADHGESFGEENQYFVHRLTTPDIAHVPMILRAAPAKVSGIALAPPLRAGTPLPERVVFTDIGAEVSAYSQSGFRRIRGVAAAWLQRPDAQGALAPSATRYAWDGGSAWNAVGEQAVFSPEVDRYLRSAVTMRAAPDPSDGDLKRLQALGYLEAAQQ